MSQNSNSLYKTPPAQSYLKPIIIIIILQLRQLLEKILAFKPEFDQYDQSHVFENISTWSNDQLKNFYSAITSFSLPFLMQSWNSAQTAKTTPSVPSPTNSPSNTNHNLGVYSSHGLDLSALDDETVYSNAINSINLIEKVQHKEFLSSYVPTTSNSIAPPTPDDSRFYLYTALESLVKGNSGSVLLAGGQGSRLQFPHSKAIFPVETPTNQTLLLRTLYNRYLLLQITRLYYNKVYGGAASDQEANIPKSEKDVVIPLILLTSPQTNQEIINYIKSLQTTLLNPTNIKKPASPDEASSTTFTPPMPLWLTAELLTDIFTIQQGCLPAVDASNGKLIITENTLMMSPNGNGGIYSALFPLLEQLKLGTAKPVVTRDEVGTNNENNNNKNIGRVFNLKQVMSLNIDNIYNKVCDPIMLGYTIYRDVDVVVKTVPKSNPSERVGVVAIKDNTPQIVEYTEIGDVASSERDDKGVLKYIDGNTNIVVYKVDFLFNVRAQLCAAVDGLKSHTSSDSDDTSANNIGMALHHAPKIFKFQGVETNIVKFELFAFDCFVYAKSFSLVRVNRHTHFLPIKNKNSDIITEVKADTPRYCMIKSYQVVISVLIRLGYTIHDCNGKVIVVDDSLGFSNNHVTAIDSNNVALKDAVLGHGIEFDVTQFYAITYPSVNPHHHLYSDDNTLIQSIPADISDENKIIKLSNEYGLIFHANGTISQVKSP